MSIIDRNLIFVILCIFLITLSPSCLNSCNSAKKNGIPISSLDKTENERFFRHPTKFYGKYNFLLDSIGRVYYYSIDINNRQNYSEWESDTIPHFVNLKPFQLLLISENHLLEFLKNNVLADCTNDWDICIGSQKDTICSPSFDLLYSFIYDSSDVSCFFRRSTQEEDIVLYYKNKCKYFDARFIKWDSSKVYFVSPPSTD